MPLPPTPHNAWHVLSSQYLFAKLMFCSYNNIFSLVLFLSSLDKVNPFTFMHLSLRNFLKWIKLYGNCHCYFWGALDSHVIYDDVYTFEAIMFYFKNAMFLLIYRQTIFLIFTDILLYLTIYFILTLSMTQWSTTIIFLILQMENVRHGAVQYFAWGP